MTLTADRTVLTSAEVVERSPISYRQLLYWESQGLIAPSTIRYGTKRWDPSVLAQIEDLVARIDACPFDHNSVRRPRR